MSTAGRHGLALASLRAVESYERARADFSRLPTADEVMGADPYRVAALGDGFVGILRGVDALVWLDRRGEEQMRLATPRGPTGLAVAGDAVVVSGEYGGEIARYRLAAGGLVAEGRQRIAGAAALRDVALGDDGTVYAVDEMHDALYALPASGLMQQHATCASPVRLVKSGAWLALSCIVDHLVQAWPLDDAGMPYAPRRFAIEHDGPAWGLALFERGAGARVAIGAVEDAQLDRSGGFFGHVDSFLFVYDVDREQRAERLLAFNLSEQQLITPKALAFDAAGKRLLVAGYGGARMARFDVGERHVSLAETQALPPGSNDMAFGRDGSVDGVLVANPLMDAWVRLDGGMLEVAGPRPDAHRQAIRLGEALFFTTLMAPFNDSAGKLSRFSCETCHFEGYVDGRTHHTGRGEVHATTKPLLSLFSNKPHFTRALDPDLTQVSHAEFRVAGAGNDVDPWFALSLAEHPWLERMVGARDAIGPLELRTALMRFLMAFNHRPNPLSLDMARWGDDERQGAERFEALCARCHAPRLSADDPASEVPFAGWEALVLDRRGPITWASSGYHKTGVEPYVHPDGARTTSLRRLYKKRPYFSNGSARTLTDVLERVLVRGDALAHDGPLPGGAPLSPAARRELLAFLRLL